MGLGLAIPFALLSLIQVVNVYEYDNFHPHPDRTYRIITDVTDLNGNKIKYAATPFALAGKLKTDYPFVEQSTNVIGEMGWELTNRIKTIRTNVLFTEPSFFDIFGFYLEKGTLPVSPNSIVLTHEKAEIFFWRCRSCWQNPFTSWLWRTENHWRIKAVQKKYTSQNRCDDLNGYLWADE